MKRFGEKGCRSRIYRVLLLDKGINARIHGRIIDGRVVFVIYPWMD